MCFLFHVLSFFFFFNDTATTEIYTLSLHDALPISAGARGRRAGPGRRTVPGSICDRRAARETRPRRDPRNDCRESRGQAGSRSEEHTSELQSQSNLVCRLLLEKKKKNAITRSTNCR